MKLKLALQSLARQALRRLPIDVEDPTLDDKMTLLEHRLRTVERKTAGSVPKPRAPTEQEMLLTAMWSMLEPKQEKFLDDNRPGWRSIMAEIDRVDEAFRQSGGLYHPKPGGPFPEVIPVRPA